MARYMIFKLRGTRQKDPEFYMNAPVKADSAEQAIRKAVKRKENRTPTLKKANSSEGQDFLAVPMNNWNTYEDVR